MKIVSLTDLAELEVSHNPVIKKKMMLTPGELPHLTNFSQAKFPPGEIAKAHSHESMWEVFFVEAGNGIIKINQQEYPLEPGTCIAVAPNEVHELINSGSKDLILTYFGIQPQK